ncbi:hypothetical protein [Sphingomonas bacterium]|uniref:hypothetical protein n=1 Tax=Sphingomonas bacterium TaxID=1895847 RepID=UPI00157560CC|nr:hypothetical protein [Sphingomonas bacterium]
MRAASQPQGVTGTFGLTVRAVGEQGGVFYLNSELDYRDQRNLSIAIPADLYADLAARLGGSPREKLLGKHIEVTGVARRVTIFFLANGRRTDKYYYQTHIELHSLDDLKLPR